MSVSRKLKNLNIGYFGLALCASLILAELISFIGNLMLPREGGIDWLPFIYLVISVIFYIFVARNFLVAKDANSLSAARVGIIILIISNYIIPLIRMLLLSIFTLNVFLFIGGFSLMTIAGVLYFVFLILEFKKDNKASRIGLLICGALIALGSLFTTTIYVLEAIQNFVAIPNNIAYLLLGFGSIFNAIGELMFGALLLFYGIKSYRRYKGRY